MADLCKSLSVTLLTHGSDGKDLPLEVNSSDGIPFESPGFRGRVLLLNRPDPETPDWSYHKHFEDKMRRFEFRLQGVFLKEPGDNLYFGVELAKAAHLGYALRMTANWILSVLSILCAARGISYVYDLDFRKLPNGDVVRPHLAFPVVAADAIIRTPCGEVPPPITKAIQAVPQQEKLSMRFNTEDTFTFAYWTKQADFERWDICNMPFGWSSSFANFIGPQPVYLTAYRLEGGDGQGEAHSEARKARFMTLVMSNTRAGAQPEALAAAPSSTPTPARRWSLEEAELPLEELDRLWGNDGEAEKPDPGSNSLNSGVFAPWSVLTKGMCTCTSERHGIR
mmetsp:Transcript_94524/g.300005  ORF Transcript_94524/g.300005 Transcript_94524/m.300005 type:complete len:338 (-) Transcript_94524:155-1168(-)